MKTNRLFYLIELAAVAALYFFENNSGTRAALAVSALVPLLSVLCAYRCSRRAALSLDVPRHGEKGAPLVCRLCAPPLPLCPRCCMWNFRIFWDSPMWTIRKRRKSFRTSSLLRQEKQ